MAQYAIVDSSSKIRNMTEWDGSTAWPPPSGTQAVLDTVGADQNWTYANGAFVPPTPAPPPPPPSPREWLERLSPATQAQITAAATGGTSLMLWLFKAMGSSYIDVTAQETKDGVAVLVAAGIITEADQATLLAP